MICPACRDQYPPGLSRCTCGYKATDTEYLGSIIVRYPDPPPWYRERTGWLPNWAHGIILYAMSGALFLVGADITDVICARFFTPPGLRFDPARDRSVIVLSLVSGPFIAYLWWLAHRAFDRKAESECSPDNDAPPNDSL